MQNLFTYIILASFLLATLVLGIWAGRGVKTMKDYVLANRELSTPVITMSLVATFVSGGDFRQVDYIFKLGIIDTLVPAFVVISFLMIGYFLAPRMIYFQDCLTIGDMMGKLYGKSARVFTGLTNVLFALLIISSQFRSIGYINRHLLGLPTEWVILIVGSLVVIYTALSGMRGVAYTDCLQFIAMISIFLLVLVSLFFEIDGWQFLKKLPSERLSFFEGKPPGRLYQRVEAAIFWGLIPSNILSSAIVHRMLMVRDKRKVQKMFFSGATIYGMVSMMLVLIGLGATVYFNNRPERLTEAQNTSSLLAFLSSLLFSENKTMQILLFLGLLFVLLSTIDSYLHSMGVAFVYDVIKPFSDERNVAINEISWARWATFLIGILAVLLGCKSRNFQGLGSWGYYPAIIISSMIIVPLIIGILGVITNKISFVLFCLGLTGCMGILYPMIGGYQSDLTISNLTQIHMSKYMIVFISIAVAILVYFISHYIVNKGFATVNRTKHVTSYNIYRPTSRGLFSNRLFSLWLSPTELAKAAQRRVYRHGSEPFLFSLFFVCIPILFLLNIGYSLRGLYVIMGVYGVGIILVAGLMLESKWLRVLKPYFDLYWFFVLCYCLPFLGMLLFLGNQQSYSALLCLAIALLTLVLCVDWRMFLLLAGVGTTVALAVYRFLSGHFFDVMDFDMAWNFFITLTAVLLTGFFFSRRKELYSFGQLKKAKLYAGSIAHETNNYLGVSMFAGDVIKHALKNKKFKRLEGKDAYVIPKELYESLMFLGPQLSVGAKQSVDKIKMFMSALREDILGAKKEMLSVKACVEEALKDTYFQDEKVKKGLLLELDNDFEAEVSKSYFKHVLYNIIKNAFHHGGASKVKVCLDKSERRLVIRDDGVGISREKLPYVFDLFYSGGGSSGIGLALVKLIVESFGAKVHVESKRGKNSFTEFSVTFF